VSDGKSSFFHTLPGILTGLAGLISAGAAVGALVIGLNGGDDPKPDNGPIPPTAVTTDDGPPDVTLAEWAAKANAICADDLDDVKAIGASADQEQAIPQLRSLITRVKDKISALERPPEAEAQIREFLDQFSRAETALANLQQALAAGDHATAEAEAAAFEQADARQGELSRALGANVCAGP
jgi:hypothetical protein